MPNPMRRATRAAKDHPKTTLGALVALLAMLVTLSRAHWDPAAVDLERLLYALAVVIMGVFAGDGDKTTAPPA